ncbi:hypothetical protein LLG96_17860 [bacterium]|nr:hypothetical protein [bacterium]
MNDVMKKPLIYSDIETLTVKMEQEKKRVRELLEQASKISCCFHPGADRAHETK